MIYVKEQWQTKVQFIKKHKDAQTPTKAHLKEDAGWDLYSIENTVIKVGEYKIVATGIHMAIPPGYVGKICGRSSFAFKGLQVHPGIIDSGFRHEVSPIVYNHSNQDYQVNKGDRVCQLLIEKVEDIEFEESKSLSSSERGNKGFGSSGR